MLRNLSKVFVLISLLCSVNAYALNEIDKNDKFAKETIKIFKHFNYKDIEKGEFKLHDKKYTAVVLNHYEEDRLGILYDWKQCYGIFLSDKEVVGKFCYEGIPAWGFTAKDDTFTVVGGTQDRVGRFVYLQIVFRLINGEFYLDKYRKDFGHFAEDNETEIIEKIRVYYDASRDDPKGNNKIHINELTPKMLDKFKDTFIYAFLKNLQEAVDKFYDYKQITPSGTCSTTYDYELDTTIKPSFKCSNQFEKYSLEDFICNSNFNAFKDNYFASLYNRIIKQNPSLRDKALKIARERLKETKKECLIYTKEQFDYSRLSDEALKIEIAQLKAANVYTKSLNDHLACYNAAVEYTVICINNTYRIYTAKLALMLYDNDKELFKKIFGKNYEKFKEAFEDTSEMKSEDVFFGIMTEESDKRVSKFADKYRNEYDLEEYEYYDSGNPYKHYVQYGTYILDLIYILSIQYDLIDSTGKFK